MANITLMKRGSSWQYRFDAANIEGKRKQISKAGFKTKAEAREAGFAAYMSYHHTGFVYNANGFSVSDYLDEWFKHYCTVNQRYNTQIHHSRLILAHLKPKLGAYFLKDLTPKTIQLFITDLVESGLSIRYIREIIAILSMSLKTAVDTLRLIPENPCDKVILPKRISHNASRDRFIISGEEFKEIINLFPEESPARIPLLLGYLAGLRIGEVFALSWNDVDFATKTIHVHRNATYKAKESKALDYISKQKAVSNTYGWHLGPTKTECSVRTLLIDSYLVDALKKYKEIQEKNREFFDSFYTVIYEKIEQDTKEQKISRLVEVERGIPVILKEANLICVDEFGRYFSYERFKKHIKLIKEKLNIPFNFHSLRHTHATLLLQEGANVKDVQERLGHSNAMITLKLYTHNTQTSKKKSVEILENHLKEITKS